jgi:hypothetical protein
VLNTSGVTITTHGAHGANITNYDWLLDAQGVVLGHNYEPNAHIVAPRTIGDTQSRPSFSLVAAVIRLGCTLAGSPGILG